MSETLRDLVVSLSLQTDNFTRNIKSVSKQIAEAESQFKLAAAGVEGFERTTTGLATQLSTLERRLSLQRDAVDQYQRALEAANNKLSECYNRQNDYAQRLENAKAAQQALKEQVAAAAQQVRAFSATLGDSDSATIAAKANLDALKGEYRASAQEVKKLSGQNTALQKTTQNAADAVSQANTNLNLARAGVKQTEAEIVKCNQSLKLAQTSWDAAGKSVDESRAAIVTFGKQIGLAESRFKLATAGIKDMDASIAGLSAKLTLLNEKLGIQQKSVAEYENALRGAKEQLQAAQRAHSPEKIRQASDAVIDAEAALNKAKAAVRETAAEIEKTNKQLASAKSAWTAAGKSLEAALLARQQAALAQALATEDTASRTATMAGVLAAEGGDFEATSAASAAAQHMMTQYGSQTAIEMTREILLTAAELRMSGETLRAALHTAALGEGASAAVLSQIMTEGPSTQLLGSLVDAASEDVSSPAVQETMRKAVTDNQIATRVKALIADGALSGLRSYEESVSKASSELRTAQKGFSTAANDYRVAGENLESLQAQWAQNPSDAALQGAMQQAVRDVGGKAIVVEQYRQSVEKAQGQVKKAQDALASVREETMKRIREQAQQEVMQAKEQARAEREAVQQQTQTQTALFDRMPDREFTPVTMPETDVWQYIEGNKLKRGDILRDVFAALTGRNRKSPYGGIVVNNADTGLDIHIGEKSVRHGLNRNNTAARRGIAAAFSLDEIVKKAVQVGRGTPRSGKADARVMLSAVTDGKLVYPVTLLVEQIQDGSMEVIGTEALPGINRQQLYSYSVKMGIKTEPAVPRTDAAETSSLTSTGSGISIAKLYEAVKGNLAKTVEGFREDDAKQERMITSDVVRDGSMAVDGTIRKDAKPSFQFGENSNASVEEQVLDREYRQALEAGDMARAQEMVNARAEAASATVFEGAERDNVVFSIRTKPAPKKTIQVYKLFDIADGMPRSLYIDEATPKKSGKGMSVKGKGTAIPVGVWLDGKEGAHYTDAKGRKRVISRLGDLAYRPGWHASSLPLTGHIGDDVAGVPYGKVKRPNQVYYLCEIDADYDYADEVAELRERTGDKTLGLDHLPTDGFYEYKTNTNASDDVNWYISGAIKIVRPMTETEVNDILREHSLEPQLWETVEGTKIRPASSKTKENATGPLDLAANGITSTEPVVNTGKLLDTVTFDDDGKVIPLSRRFDVSNPDVRYDTIQMDGSATGIPQPGQSSGPVKSGDTIMKELADALELAADTRTKKYLRQLRRNTNGYTRMRTVPDLYGIAEPAQADVTSENRRAANAQARQAVEEAIEAIRNGGDTLSAEAEAVLLGAMDALPEQGWVYHDTVSGNDVLNVPRADGTIGRWTVYNTDMLEAMLAQPPRQTAKTLRAIGQCTRFLCSMATGRSFSFALQNYASDTETAMNTGHGAGNWLTFIPQQIGTMFSYLNDTIRDRRGLETSEAYRQFQVFGQMGSRFAFRDTRTQAETRSRLYGGRPGAKEIAKTIASSPVIALEAISGFLEDSTRYNEFRHSGENLDTYSGRLLAGKDAREVTTDFSKRGSAEETKYAKLLIPFFGAQVQGVYKTARLFSSENAGHRAQIAGRILINGVMANLILAAIRNLTWKDEEKEAYGQLSAYETNKYYHFKIGEGKFIRIKRSQDALIQTAGAIGTLLGNTMTGYEGDAWGDLVAASKETAGNMVTSFDTVADPFFDAANNQTWYGGAIEDYNMQNLPTTARYEAETPKIYRYISGVLNTADIQYSPLDVEYIVSQYTGSLGVIGSGILGLGTEGNLTAEAFVSLGRSDSRQQ